MKICVLSDIHGNIRYLNAVLDHCAEMAIDRFFFLGDSIGYFPHGIQVLKKLREIDTFCVKGNHEALLLGLMPLDPEKDKVYHLEDQGKRLSEEDMLYIKSWPITRQHEYDGVKLFFLHGTIADPLNGYGYEDGEFSEFDQPDVDVVFIGQTHRPWQQKNNHTLIINVGSVGLPRDYGNSPSFAIFDTITRTADIHRIIVDPEPILSNPGNLHPSVISCLKRR